MTIETFGDNLDTLQTDPTSEPGNMDLLSMLFNKVVSEKDSNETKSVEKFRQNKEEEETKPKKDNGFAKFKSILRDLQKAVLLTLLFLGMRTEIFRSALGKVTNKPILAEVMTVALFVLLTLVMLRFV